MFRRSTYLHIGFQSLRATLLYKTQVLRMLESRFFCLGNDSRNLLEGTEHDHAWCAFLALSGFLFEQSRCEGEEVGDGKTVICIEGCFMGQLAFTLRPVALVIPGRITSIHLLAQFIW